MDPENPVVKLCVEGMRAEGQGRLGDAHDLFLRAWNEASDDWEACIAAHYLARHQPTHAETLRWNDEALRRALAVTDGRARGFFPSLYLNLAASYEQEGAVKIARELYEAALARMDEPGAPPTEAHVRASIERGARRPIG
ncbi:MAG TPA: hypothetical protein VFJ16_04060 [Longimicrobium sp.]|nr:hypothetical protein [Longimicrobium sp.]